MLAQTTSDCATGKVCMYNTAGVRAWQARLAGDDMLVGR